MLWDLIRVWEVAAQNLNRDDWIRVWEVAAQGLFMYQGLGHGCPSGSELVGAVQSCSELFRAVQSCSGLF